MVRRKTASATAREQVKLFRFIKSRRETAWLYPFGYDNKETAHFNGYTVVVYWPNYRVKHFIFRRRFLCNVDVSSFSISCSLYFPQCSGSAANYCAQIILFPLSNRTFNSFSIFSIFDPFFLMLFTSFFWLSSYEPLNACPHLKFASLAFMRFPFDP